ncbi:hypothetical protein YC2023_023077 [Brassica napus]
MGVGPTSRAWAADAEGANRGGQGRTDETDDGGSSWGKKDDGGSSWGKKDDGESSWNRMQNANKDMRSS